MKIKPGSYLHDNSSPTPRFLCAFHRTEQSRFRVSVVMRQMSRVPEHVIISSTHNRFSCTHEVYIILIDTYIVVRDLVTC